MEKFNPVPPISPSETTPFFLNDEIPFPDNNAPSNGNATLQQELIQNWEKASEDFREMYKSEAWGKPIRDAFGDRIDSHLVTLEEVGELVGANSSNILRRVRAALQVGELVSKTDVGIWKFTGVETVQLMVGFLARKYRYRYSGVSNNPDSINSDFHETV